MSYRGTEEALRVRIEELEGKLASANEADMAKQLNKAVRELKRAKRDLSHALDERDQAREDHRKLAAKPRWFQRSSVFGGALGMALVALLVGAFMVGIAGGTCAGGAARAPERREHLELP
jgi:uncharacterized membrane protein YccC